MGAEKSNFPEGPELLVNLPLSPKNLTLNQCRPSKAALLPPDGMFGGKQPEKGNISRYLSLVMGLRRGVRARVCQKLFWDRFPVNRLESPQRGLTNVPLFPQVNFLRNLLGGQKWDQYRPECLDIFFSLAFWKVNEPCTADAPSYSLHAPPRTGLHWLGPASPLHFNLKSKTSKLFPTLAPGWHLRAKLWIKNTLIHSYSLRERKGMSVCVCVCVSISFKLYKFNICPRKWRTKQKSNKNCNPKLRVGGETLTCFSLKRKIVLFCRLPRNSEVSGISNSSPPGRRIIFLLSLLNHYLSPAKIDYSPWDNDSPSFPLLITVIINIHVTN